MPIRKLILSVIVSFLMLDCHAKCFYGPSLLLYQTLPGEEEVACHISGSHTLYLASGSHYRIEMFYGDCPPMIYSIRKNGTLLDTAFTFEVVEYLITEPGIFRFHATDEGMGGSILDRTFTVIDDPTIPIPFPIEIWQGIFLQGPYDQSTNRMKTDLQALDGFPISEPYSDMGWIGGGSGGEILSAGYIGQLPNSILVDWIRIEIRPQAEPHVVVAARNVLLGRDGSIVNAGSGVHTFTANLPAGSYHLVFKHRNHLPIMTMPYDHYGYVQRVSIADPSVPVYGIDTRVNVSPNRAALRAGNSRIDEGDQLIKYTGASNDRDKVLLKIGGQVPTTTVSGYFVEDLNLDGFVKYTGANNDRDLILQAIGGVIPTTVITAPIP